MLVINEQTRKGRSKLIQLTYEDFLEVIVRWAYRKALPTDEELNKYECKHAGEFLASLDAVPGKLTALI